MAYQRINMKIEAKMAWQHKHGGSKPSAWQWRRNGGGIMKRHRSGVSRKIGSNNGAAQRRIEETASSGWRGAIFS